MPRHTGLWIGRFLIAALIAWLLAAPLALALWPAVTDPAAAARVWGSTRTWLSLGQTLGMAAAVAVAAVIVSLPAACWLGRCRPTTARWLGLALLAPLLILPIVHYYGWELWVSFGGPLDAVLTVAGWRQYERGPLMVFISLLGWLWPLPALVGGMALRSADADLFRQAALEPGGPRKWLGVQGAVLAAPMTAGGVVVLLLAAGETTVPPLSNLQWMWFPNELMERLSSVDAAAAPDAAWMGLPLVAIVLTLILLPLRRLLRVGEAMRFTAAGAARPHVGQSRWGVRLGTLACFAVLACCPLGMIVARGGSPAAVWGGLVRLGQQTFGTVALAAGAATLSLGIALAAVGLLRGRLRAPLVVLAWTVLLLPGPLLGGRLIELYNRDGPLGWLYDSPGMFMTGMAARYMAVALAIGAMVQEAADRQIADAASVDGAGPFRRWLHVHLPGGFRVLLTGWLLLAGLCLSTGVDIAGQVRRPGMPLLSFYLLEQFHYEPVSDVIAGSLTSVAFVLALLAILGVALGRRRGGA